MKTVDVKWLRLFLFLHLLLWSVVCNYLPEGQSTRQVFDVTIYHGEELMNWKAKQCMTVHL